MAFTSQCWDALHGEDQYKQWMVQHFNQPIHGIGPVAGMKCAGYLMNDCKTNKVGCLELMLMAHHSDPICDSAAWHGMKWLHQLLVMKGKLPDFLDYKELFMVPTYRQVKKPCHLSPNSYSDLLTSHSRMLRLSPKSLLTLPMVIAFAS